MKHGLTYHSLYKAWAAMKYRCFNKNNTAYKYYGARGITVCDRWRYSFVYFLNDIGPRPTKNHSLDRIDNDGNYEPGNCRWATQKEQMNNARAPALKKRCKYGHLFSDDNIMWLFNGKVIYRRCKKCRNEYDKKYGKPSGYYQKNKELIKKRASDWYYKNKAIK